MTPEDRDAMLAAQGGGCPGCGRTPEEVGRPFHVDHDHSCCGTRRSCPECRRGVLCPDCNLGLGKLKDDPAILRSLADYVERARAARLG